MSERGAEHAARARADAEARGAATASDLQACSAQIALVGQQSSDVDALPVTPWRRVHALL